MRRALPLLLALAPAAALAGDLDWGVGGAKSVEIAGPVEVPLYRGPATRDLPAVWVTGPAPKEGEGLVAGTLATVDMAGGWTTVSEGFAKQLGGKPKKGRATLPELHIGEVVLRDVRVKVVESGPSVVLGVATLDELGVALLASKGVLRMVPAADADALLASVGTPADATRTPAKKWWEHGHKVSGNGVSLAATGSVAGVEGQVRIRTDLQDTLVGPDATLEAQRKVAGLPEAVAAPVIAGATLPQVWVGQAGSLASPDGSVVAIVSFDALYAADIAVAPASDKIAIKAVAAPIAADPRVVLLDYAKKDFDLAVSKAAEKPEEKAEVEGADPGLPATVGRHLRYGDALLVSGKTADAITQYRAATAVAGDTCLAYQSLGKALLASGDAKGAAAEFERAGALWDRWYAQDVDTRARLKDEKPTPDATFLVVQPSGCHTAWGDAAEARLALGDHAAVADLFAKHVDLDPDLPLAYGLSLIAQGKADEANGPIRQALAMGANGSATRTALALAYQAGPVVERQVERVAFLDDEAFAMVAAVEAARRAGGDAAALSAAEELVSLDGLSVQARVVHAYELHRQGKADEVAKAVAALQPLLAAYAGRHPNSSVSGAYGAVTLALSGDAAGAEAALDAHVASFGSTSSGLVAQALVAAIAGDGAAADAALAALRASDPLDTVGLVDLSL